MITLDLPNVVIHTKREWPRLSHGYGGRNVTIPSSFQLHTTQKYVDPGLVNQKVASLQAGDAQRVSLARDSLGRYWVVDGHHTLAAYHRLGRTPRAFLYDAGSDVHPKPPRYQKGP